MNSFIFYPHRLQLALDLNAMSQAELAARLDRSPTSISLVLKGERSFTPELAEESAFVLNVPESFFTLPDQSLLDTAVAYRKKSRTSSKHVRQIKAEFTSLVQSMSRLSNMSTVPSMWKWIDALAPRTTPYSRDIEQIAQDARAALSVPSRGMVPNVIRAAERGGICVAPLYSKVNEVALMSEGISQNGNTSAPVIGYFKEKTSGDRQRFTIAHELGHILLHRYRAPSNDVLKEKEAHYFASAFLFPKEDARAQLTNTLSLQAFIPIKSHWGISIQSAIARGVNLNIISPDRQRSLMKQITARGWRTIEPVTVDYESPLLVRQLFGSTIGQYISATESAVSPLMVENFLGVPFDMASVWSNGLIETLEDYDASSLFH